MVNISELIELDRLARQDGQKYTKKRFLYSELNLGKGRHFLGIVGPRGAGKTILIKQLALASKESFYMSLDTFKDDVFQTVKELAEKLSVKMFLIDEVHMHPGFEESLKKIYDFLNVKVVFTSSMALVMYQSEYDLSRRVLL
ncbi:MAG: AAA family ATPase, partial [Candidatus Omnitrophica bacterium]|nr:AAA family ATPase [Candidatus Omnitrophota bacterium]